MKKKHFTIFLLVIVPCLLFIISSCSRSSHQADYTKRTYQILTLVDQMKYQEALSLCDKFIQAYPQSPFGYLTKGRIFKRLNRADEAIDSFREALVYINMKEHRVIAIYFGLIGDVYFRINDVENAFDFYSRALKEDPELSSSYMLDIAHVYILKGELNKANDMYNAALKKINTVEQLLEKVTGKKGNIYGKAAVVAFQLGKGREALDFVTKYHESHRDDSSKLFYAVHLAKLGHKDKAKEEFNSINRQNCDLGDLADYYLNIGNKQAAVDVFNKSYEEQKTSNL